MIFKWLFDRTISLIGLLLLWPVMAVVAILIKIRMPGGPVIFVQDRVGRGGELFKFHKFRTMTMEHHGSSVTVAGDPRDPQEIAIEYNDTVIYPDKVRINCDYYHHYSFVKDIQMIIYTVLGKEMKEQA